MNCIKCAKCNIVCPTFIESYDEVYSPRGYLHLCEILQKHPEHQEAFKGVLKQCTLCGECEKICPIDLPILQIIKKAIR